MARKVTVESQKDKVVYINADRELFGRLLVEKGSQRRNLNGPELGKYVEFLHK